MNLHGQKTMTRPATAPAPQTTRKIFTRHGRSASRKTRKKKRSSGLLTQSLRGNSTKYGWSVQRFNATTPTNYAGPSESKQHTVYQVSHVAQSNVIRPASGTSSSGEEKTVDEHDGQAVPIARDTEDDAEYPTSSAATRPRSNSLESSQSDRASRERRKRAELNRKALAARRDAQAAESRLSFTEKLRHMMGGATD